LLHISDALPAGSPEVLVAANRASTLETVVRWMLHDLRNPLQTLTLLPALADAQAEAGDAGDWREALSTASERLASGLALLDRVTAGPAASVLEPIAVGEVLDFLADLFRARRGRFHVVIAPASPVPAPAVAAIRGDLELALLNLLLNAAEASEGRTGRVTVLAHSVEGAVELVIEDDGLGVPEALRSRLFEPFVTIRTDGTALGLGLFVARHLLAKGGGELRYEPANAGSRFVVRLPEWRRLPRP
jgi:signal transduction histidine kinase